jgi:hypothetical protein
MFHSPEEKLTARLMLKYVEQGQGRKNIAEYSALELISRLP